MGQIRQWYPHHVDDFDRKTRNLSLAARGAYRALMDRYWENGGPLRFDDRQLCRAINAFPDEWTEVREDVLAFFEEKDGFLHHARIEEELDRARNVSERNQKNGKSGGRPSKAKLKPRTQPIEKQEKTQEKPSGFCLGNPDETQTETHARVVVDVIDNSSNTDSSSLTETSRHEVPEGPPPDDPPDPQTEVRSLLADPIPSFDQFWQAYPRRITEAGKAVRGSKSEAKTKWLNLSPASKRAAFEGLAGYASGAGDKPVDAVRYLRYRRWEDEVEDAPPSAATGPPSAAEPAWVRAERERRQITERLNEEAGYGRNDTPVGERDSRSIDGPKDDGGGSEPHRCSTGFGEIVELPAVYAARHRGL